MIEEVTSEIHLVHPSAQTGPPGASCLRWCPDGFEFQQGWRLHSLACNLCQCSVILTVKKTKKLPYQVLSDLNGVIL